MLPQTFQHLTEAEDWAYGWEWSIPPPPGTAVSSSPGCVALACERHQFLQAAGLSPPGFSEAEYECYLVSAGRAAANWRKKMLGNYCKQKVMNTYKVCSGDWEERGTRSWAHGEGELTTPGWWGMNQVEPPSEVWAASVHSPLPRDWSLKALPSGITPLQMRQATLQSRQRFYNTARNSKQVP